MRLRKIIAFLLAIALVVTALPNEMISRAEGSGSGQTSIIVDPSEAEDAGKYHRSTNTPSDPKKGGVYAYTAQDGLAGKNSDIKYDIENANRKAKVCIYNLRKLMTEKIGTSNDKGIGRYPYVVTKIDVKDAGYYDIGTEINMNANPSADTMVILVDGIMHIVKPTTGSDAHQEVWKKNLYLSAGEHSILYMSAMPQNESDCPSAWNTNYYPWTNFWKFMVKKTSGDAINNSVEFLDVSTLTGTDVENIFKESTRIEAEDTKYVTWNIYSKTENNTSASGGKVVGGPAYAQCQQTFEQLKNDGLDKAKTPYLQYVVEAPAAGEYYLTIGANVGTNTNNSNPVPYVAILVNNNTPVKAQFDGAWNKLDSVTVPVQLQKGINIIRCTSVTPDQYSTGTAWVNQDFLEVQKGLTVRPLVVSADDSNNGDYLRFAGGYKDDGNNFGGPTYADMRYDFPSLYEDMLGIYSEVKPERADYWPNIAFRVRAEQAGEYQISAEIANKGSGKATTVGMIVDGAMYIIEIPSTGSTLSKTVYLSEGEHVIIFTSPIPRDLTSRPDKQDNSYYQWMNYKSFQLSEGLCFLDKPTDANIQTAMTKYSRIEAEDISYASANGNYNAEISKDYNRRYNTPYTVKVKGVEGAAIDGSVSETEKKVNTTQTFEDINNGLIDAQLTSYVQYKVLADEAGSYMIRVGAYLEGSGTMPYGTILVNGKAYKAQFSGNWNGYDAVNLAVELQAGENIIQCIGVTADQTDSNAWIGYDFIDVSRGIGVGTERMEVSASDEDWDTYLKLNTYKDNGSEFGDAYYPDMRYDYPSLYEDMLGIYSEAKPDRADYWPYIAFTVCADKAGEYQISAKVGTNDSADTVGMIVDGAMYIVEVPGTSSELLKKVYLTEGEHVIIFTSPMPRDMEGAPNKNDAAYPWMNYYSFKLGAGLKFGEKPSDADIRTAMTEYTRIEAEDISFVTANGNYNANISKTYTRRYGKDVVKVKGFKGAKIDGSASDSEKKVNTTQTFEEINNGLMDTKLTSYVQYKVLADEASSYMIRVGAYLEGSGTMPYGTILVNGKAYKAQFSGNWNGYDAANLTVELQAGENIIQCIGVTADQTDSNAWIGYDFIDVSRGIGTEHKEVSASDKDWNKYLKLNMYLDNGTLFGVGNDADGYTNYGHIRYDYPSLYEDMLGIYSEVKPDRANWWPYIAFTVNADKEGDYQISAKIGTNDNADTVGMIVDGAMYVVKVSEASELLEKVYLTKGEHVIVFTSPIPRDMESAPSTRGTNKEYPYMDFYSFKLGMGLSFGEAPTDKDIQKAMTSYTRLEAEDIVYATYSGNYDTDVTKKYASRYNNALTTIMGASGAAIDGKVTAEELKANTSQSYVQYSINAKEAGVYMIRVGAYVEGNGTMPYGTILVNGTAYQVQFAGNWNGYDGVNIPVELQAGTNTIQCIGVTADQTGSNAWIGYDYLDIQSGLSANETGATVINAGDEKLVTFNDYKDQGDILDSGSYGDLRWDRLSLDMLNYAYLGRMPYAAIQVKATVDGTYDVYFKSQYDTTATSKQMGVLVDGVTTYSMSLSEFRSHVSIPLTAGTHTLVFTTPMPADLEAASMTAKMDKKAYPWMNMLTIILGKGLTVQKAPDKNQLEKPFKTIQVEECAIPNLTRIKEKAAGSAQYLKAQKAAEIVKNGIDATVTPYVEYHIDASAAGEYTIYVALTSGMIDSVTAEKLLCNIVIENGDTRQVKKLYTHKDTSGVARIIPVTLTLQKGINEVRITHFTGDSIQGKGYVWNDFDYIEMSPETAKKITFLPPSILEAEDATFMSYGDKIDESMSGGGYLGSADYGYIDENQITFEALDVENLDDVPRVTYTFEAEKAGTYTLSVKFRTGLINYKPEELEKIGFAVIVNGKDKQLVEYEMAALTASITRTITVELVEGENEITFTSTLADFMNAVKPRIESDYRLVYVDHDALYLSYGLSEGKEAEKFSVEDSSVERSQLELLGIAGDEDNISGITAKQVAGIVLSVVVLATIVTLIILVVKRKKQEKENRT